MSKFKLTNAGKAALTSALTSALENNRLYFGVSIKPGSRPTKRNWCAWLQAIVEWSPEERAVADEKAERAWRSSSAQAMYAAGIELKALGEVKAGTFKHSLYCHGSNCTD